MDVIGTVNICESSIGAVVVGLFEKVCLSTWVVWL